MAHSWAFLSLRSYPPQRFSFGLKMPSSLHTALPRAQAQQRLPLSLSTAIAGRACPSWVPHSDPPHPPGFASGASAPIKRRNAAHPAPRNSLSRFHFQLNRTALFVGSNGRSRITAEESAQQMLAPLLIYIVLTIVGLLAFWGLIRIMRGSGVASPPVLAYFVLFFTLGGWAQVLLTAAYWDWSGLASTTTMTTISAIP